MWNNRIDIICILLYSNGNKGEVMSKILTLRLDEPVYKLFKTMAVRENRPVSNFIETAVLRFVEENQMVDEYEMEEIRSNTELNNSLKRGIHDAKKRRGRFV